MKKTNIIGILILILLVILLVIILFIANLTLLKEKDENEVINENSNNIIENSTENTNSSDNFSANNNVAKSVVPATVDDFNFEVKGITPEISKYIENIEDFKKSIKEFVYKYGMVDATFAEVQKYEYQESTNRLGIIFKLNDPAGDKLRVIVDSNGEVSILYYD